MSCSTVFRLSLLFIAELAAPGVEAACCSLLDEAAVFIQGEIHVKQRLRPESSAAGSGHGGGSPLGSELRDRLERLSSTTSANPSSGSESVGVPDPFSDWGSGGNYSNQWQKALALDPNGRGDLTVLGLSFATNGSALLVCLIAVGILRRIYPELYENNARPVDEGGFDSAPVGIAEHFFGWATAGLSVSQEQMRTCVGVDEMMLIEFANFSMRLLFVIGVPLVCILCPLHLFVGGNHVDRLSQLGMANMSTGSYAIWVHVFMIWYVVLVVENLVHSAMHKFLDVRVRWLLELEPPRSTTVLVEGIPERWRSDAELKAYFEMLFPNCIESVYLVKKTRRLSKLVKRVEVCRLRLEQAMFEWQNHGEDPSRRPTFYSSWFMRFCSSFVKNNDKIDYYKEMLSTVESELDLERKRIVEASADPLVQFQDASGRTVNQLTERARAVNAHTGFVTFTTEREARLMLGMRCTASQEEWITHVPPHHEDVIYEDLQVKLGHVKIMHFTGYACVVGVFFSFLPLICGVGTLASFDSFKRHFNIGDGISPSIGMVFEGVVASLALTTFTSFLPTILMLVFSSFFVLRAGAWAQLKLQTWLFWFNLIFVVLVTSLGGTLIGRLKELIMRPFSGLTLLAESLPHFTHFYLNYMLMQWVIHFLNLTRYIQLIKYFIWRAVVGPERAVVLTEPEDQDYYGIGSRSAQWTINLVIGIVFCTLCPLVTIFTFVNFFFTRVVYGYLVVFAEIRKPDLGGPFFVTQLWHTQYGLLVYAVLMVGVIWHRSQNNIAMVMATAPTIAYILTGFYYFYTNYQWESLPFEELCTDEAKDDFVAQIDAYRALGKDRPCYVQQELIVEESRPSSPKLEQLRERANRAKGRGGGRGEDIVGNIPSQEGHNGGRRNMRQVNVDAMVGGTAVAMGGGMGSAGSAVNARAAAALDVGLDFVNRHFTEWHGRRGGEEEGKSSTRPRIVRARSNLEQGDRSRRKRITFVREGDTSDESDDDYQASEAHMAASQTWTPDPPTPQQSARWSSERDKEVRDRAQSSSSVTGTLSSP